MARAWTNCRGLVFLAILNSVFSALQSEYWQETLSRLYRLGNDSDAATNCAIGEIAMVADEYSQKHSSKFFDGTPDLAVEVLSPDDSASSVNEKAERKTAAACVLDDENVYLTRSVTELAAPKLLPGFNLSIEQLFQ